MNSERTTIQVNPKRVKERFEMLQELFHDKFLPGLIENYRENIYLCPELLHCAVKAYFDDKERYKAYAGSEFADRHKQAAYTIKWINKFRPIQLKEGVEVDAALVTMNQKFAIYAGFVFLDPSVLTGISQDFFQHLVYTLTYRPFTGKMLATLAYTIECATKNNGLI